MAAERARGFIKSFNIRPYGQKSFNQKYSFINENAIKEGVEIMTIEDLISLIAGSHDFNVKALEDECKSCFEKSFNSHEKAVFWDMAKNNNLKTRDVFKHSGKKYWFICEEGHSFDATLAHISSEKEPRWCPFSLFSHNFLEGTQQ